jgi:hypothetical protein
MSPRDLMLEDLERALAIIRAGQARPAAHRSRSCCSRSAGIALAH